MMDSGGKSGRAWQQNQGRDFDTDSIINISKYDDGDVTFSLSTYYFLSQVLEITPMSEQLMDEYSKLTKGSEESYMADMIMFGEWLEDNQGATGLYGDGKPEISNSYNHESALDQVIQFLHFQIEHDGYALLQIHGGADVRGGYTAPYLFGITLDPSAIYLDMDIDIRFEDGSNIYSDDAGYNWYEDSDTVIVKGIPGKYEENPKYLMVNADRREVSY